MNDSKTRTLILVALIGLALVAPSLLAPKKPQGAPPTGTNQPHSAQPEPTAPPPPEQPASVASPAARLALQKLGKIETDTFSASVSNLNGGLTHFRPKAARYRSRGEPVDIVTTDKEAYLPLAIEVDGLKQDASTTWALSQLSPRAVLLTREDSGLFVSRKLEAGQGPYQLWLTTHIENRGATTRAVRLHISTSHYVSREAEGGNVPFLPVRSSAASNALCRHDGDLERKDRKALGTAFLEYKGRLVFAGVENVYFLSAVAPDSGDAERCRIEASDRGEGRPSFSFWSLFSARGATPEPLGALLWARLSHREVQLAHGDSKTYRTLAYFGPKSPVELNAAGHSLKEAIQSGWFTTLAEGLTWLLRKIHDTVGNWGVAIVLLTLLVKVVLFPLTAKQMQSMGRMKELKPELDRINELYGDDREKKGAAIMELYRKRGVNPMAGCFPVLLQMPIWFSLYASLSSNVELFRAPFILWWADLSSPDPLFVLPLGLGALMFVQQKMSPATGVDPVQQKMMLYMMPAMITSLMLFLPAGLCLYMLTNSALSIGQQRLIEARLKAAAAGKAQAANTPTDNPILSSQHAAEPAVTTSSLDPQRAARSSKAERRWRRGKR
jgi:YidC/Oxa1 family membrane protein insertase